MAITTTLKLLRDAGACISGYNRLVRNLQGSEFSEKDAVRQTYIRFAHTRPISLSAIIDSNGIEDALWALRACDQTPTFIRASRLFAVWCARQVQGLTDDPRSLAVLDVAERHANGMATDAELAAAWAAAWAAARAAARAATEAAARAAAWAATEAAAWAAAEAARAAALAAERAARDAQKQKFIEFFCGEGGINFDALVSGNPACEQ